MKIYIGSDHRGFELKEELKKWLYENGYEYEDLGAYEIDPNDDYPIYAERVAQKVSESLKSAEEGRGILLCGSGVGVDIVANKFEHIRSGLAVNVDQVKSARTDDDINILSIPSDYSDPDWADNLIKAFLTTEYKPSKTHDRRLHELDEIEEEKH